MQNDIYNSVNLISGGIDSYILSWDFPEAKNLYFDFGQRYAKEEIKALRSLGVEFDCVKIENTRIFDGIFIPNRNLAMAALASMLYNPRIIRMAGLRDDNCKDKTKEEFERMSEILTRYSNQNVEVQSPYWALSKGELVALHKNLPLEKTFSCYHPTKEGKPCGNCPACLRRTIALETNGIESGVALNDDIIREYLGKIHSYDPDRVSRFFIWLRAHGGVEAIDIDGILAEDCGNYANRKFLNEPPRRYRYRVLYTARLESDRETTKQWLLKNRVAYDALIMNKLPYDILIDDKSITK